MTASQLLTWFRQAAPGDRIRYYRGNLAQRRITSGSYEYFITKAAEVVVA